MALPTDGLGLFRILAADLAAIADVTVENFLEIAASRHTASEWGGIFGQAMVHYAAAMLIKTPGTTATTATTDTAGPVTARKAGGLSESYGSVAALAIRAPGDAELATTYHGRQYLHLRDTRAAGVPQQLSIGPIVI